MWLTILKYILRATNGRVQQALKAPNFGGRVGGFPICSHHVHKKVLMCSYVVPQVPNVLPKGVPNNTWLQTHVFWPKSSPFHLYRCAKRGGSPSIGGALSLVIDESETLKILQKKILAFKGGWNLENCQSWTEGIDLSQLNQFWICSLC
jgi:hypothetical protein